jgi:hypothetical protein
MKPGTCPTVCIVSPESPGGFKVINESDLTKDHEIWTDEKSAQLGGVDAVVDMSTKRGRAPNQNKPMV